MLRLALIAVLFPALAVAQSTPSPEDEVLHGNCVPGLYHVVDKHRLYSCDASGNLTDAKIRKNQDPDGICYPSGSTYQCSRLGRGNTPRTTNQPQVKPGV